MSPGSNSNGPKNSMIRYVTTIIANDPTTSCTAVSKGPPHFPLSRWNINVNSNGARVPVHPAVKIPMNCATNIEKANATQDFPSTKAMAAIIKPIDIPFDTASFSDVRGSTGKFHSKTS